MKAKKYAAHRQQRVEQTARQTLPRGRLPMGELLRDPLAQPGLDGHGGIAEDHLRAHVSAVDAAIEDAGCHHQEHQEHHGEENDGELVDPEFIARKVEALFGDVEADNIEERQCEECQEAEQVNPLAEFVPASHAAPHGRPEWSGRATRAALPPASCETAARRLLQRGKRTKEEAAPRVSRATAVPRSESQHGEGAGKGAAGIHRLQQRGIDQAAGEEAEGQAESKFALRCKQAAADAFGDATILDGRRDRS